MTQSDIGRQAYHHGNLRDALVACAANLIAERKAVTFTLRELATRIKVSHSAAYRHFPDKTAILAAVAELGFRELKQRMETAQGEPWVRLQAKGVGYVLFAAEHPGYFRAMFHSDLCGKDQYAELTAEAQACSRDLTQAIEACLGPNGCSQEAIARAAGRAWAVVHGLAYLLLDDQLAYLLPGLSLGSERLEQSVADIINLDLTAALCAPCLPTQPDG